MKENLLAITGVFMPYSDTITQMTYKHLCNLDYNIDIVSFKSSEDKSIKQILNCDKNFKKFKMNYIDEDWQSVYINRKNINLFRSIKNIKKFYKKTVDTSKSKKYDILYSNSMPNYTHYAAYLVKKRMGSNIRWYASFSDPIINNPYITDKKKKNIIMYIIQKVIYYRKIYQKCAFKHADKLIFMSEELRDYMIGNDKKLLSKSIVIPITYIRNWPMYNNLIETKPKFNKDKIKFIHFGNIYGLRKIELFLKAISELKTESPDIIKKLEIHQYGNIEFSKSRLVEQYGVGDIFKIHNRVDYNECLNIMKNEADVLVIFDTILPENKIQPFLPSKVLEYLLTNKPIYSITSENSPTYRMLHKKHVCSIYDVDSIKLSILKQIKNIKAVNNNYKIYDNDFVINNTLGKELNIQEN